MTSLRRLAWGSTLAYTGMTLMSIVAFHVMVGKPVPPDADPGVWAAGYRFGMKYFGAGILCFGFIAAYLSLACAVGIRRATGAAASVCAVTLTVELIGAATGFPFGAHGYGNELGYKVLGLVPFVIPLSWFQMLIAVMALALRFRAGLVVTLALTALGLFAWDVLMEPGMSAAYPFWFWRTGSAWYGMPLANWVTWMTMGPVIGGITWWWGGKDLPAITRDPLPVVVYVVTGILPLALALQFGLYVAAAVGGAAMLVFGDAPFLPRFRAPAARLPDPTPAR